MDFRQDGVWLWNLRWRRDLYDWEKEDLERLKILIEQITPRMENTDRVKWRWSNACYFPIKDIVDKFYESSVAILPKHIINFIWKISIPPRAQLIFWLANLEKLKTIDSIVENGIIDACQAMCLLCRVEMETNSHILFTCHFSWRMWMKI